MNSDLDLQVALFGVQGVISLEKVRDSYPQEIDFKLSDPKDQNKRIVLKIKYSRSS